MLIKLLSIAKKTISCHAVYKRKTLGLELAKRYQAQHTVAICLPQSVTNTYFMSTEKLNHIVTEM